LGRTPVRIDRGPRRDCRQGAAILRRGPFAITGPGSPSVLTNVLPSIGPHGTWIGQLRAPRMSTLEAEPAAETTWVAHVNAVAERSLSPSCSA
jgi:hypothetical protein